MPGPWLGDVNITVLDSGAGVFSGPASKVQAVLGCAIGGSANQVIATASLNTLQSTFIGGPMPEAAGLVLQAGGVVYAVKLATATAGVIDGAAQSATNISGVAIVATNARITYSAQTPHVLQVGDVVAIASVVGSVEVNGTWKITAITDATHFEIAVTSITAYVSGGTVQFTGSVAGSGATNPGTAAPHFTATPSPNDDCYIMVAAQNGFTVGSAGGSVLVSLDRGTNWGSPIPVGTASTLALKDAAPGLDTGVTLNLGANGTTWVGGGIGPNGLPLGDYVRCHTIAPQPNDSGIAAGIAALAAYLAGSEAVFPIVQIVGTMASGDVANIQTALNTLAQQYLFERAIVSTRDNHAPIAWGGAGESDATWSASVLADLASTIALRVCATAGYYNMPTAFPTLFASTPAYRRPLSFALGARRAAIATQRMASKVSGQDGGNISQIVVAPGDAGDGFNYHDENPGSGNPAFDYTLPGGTGRLAAARHHFRKPGWYFCNDLLLAPQGSSYTFLARGLTMDVACGIAQSTLVEFNAADFITKPNGTLSDGGAGTINSAITGNIDAGMTNVGMISGRSIVVDQTQNIQQTSKLSVTITIQGVAYILEEDVVLSFANTLAAQPGG